MLHSNLNHVFNSARSHTINNDELSGYCKPALVLVVLEFLNDPWIVTSIEASVASLI